MKVGLFVGSIQPADGGGYVYVTELLRALEKAGSSTSHQLMLCHHVGGADIARQFSSFPSIDLDAEKAAVLSTKERLLAPFPGVVERVFDRVFGTAAATRWDERVYARHGIQFLIRLVPWNAMTLEIPFAAVLWDLQHRNNPWFPEVCGAEWTGRETKFSMLLRRAAVIYTGTQQGKREIEHYYQVPGDRIHVLAFPTPRYALDHMSTPKDPGFAQRLGLQKDYLFYPAQFWPHKNHVVVLEACKLIRDETDWDLGVVFVGSEKGNLAYVKSYASRLGLEQCTAFLGFVEQQQLVQLYKNAFCLAFATFCGPDNLPPLEAFALGCPVVASAVPGVKEQLGEAALLFPPVEHRSLARQVLLLRDQRTRDALIEAGRARVQAYTWTEYARDLIRSLDEFSDIRRAWQ